MRKRKLDPHKAEIEKMLANGATQKEVAKHFSIHPDNIYYWIKRHRITLPEKPKSILDRHCTEIETMVIQRHSIKDIALHLKVSYPTVARWIKENYAKQQITWVTFQKKTDPAIHDWMVYDFTKEFGNIRKNSLTEKIKKYYSFIPKSYNLRFAFMAGEYPDLKEALQKLCNKHQTPINILNAPYRIDSCISVADLIPSPQSA